MRNELKQKFNEQKCGAKRRGIGWKLTFEQWVEWWGDDIDNRGIKRNNLQMQRYGDLGDYELGNIKKGYPKDNRKTASFGQKNRKAEKAKIEHQKYLDSLMYEPSKDESEHDLIDEGGTDYKTNEFNKNGGTFWI